MVGEGDQLLLADGGQVGIAGHEAADALVGVLDGAFLSSPGLQFVWMDKRA